MNPDEQMAQHKAEQEAKLPSLDEAVSFYPFLHTKINELQNILEQYKEVIKDNLAEGKHIIVGNVTVEHKPGQTRFSHYENPDLLYPYLEENGMLTDCTSLDRAAINEAIKEGALPEGPFESSEATKTISSTLKFSVRK